MIWIKGGLDVSKRNFTGFFFFKNLMTFMLYWQSHSVFDIFFFKQGWGFYALQIPMEWL